MKHIAGVLLIIVAVVFAWFVGAHLRDIRYDLIDLLARKDTVTINLYVCGGGLKITADSLIESVTIDGKCKSRAAIDVESQK